MAKILKHIVLRKDRKQIAILSNQAIKIATQCLSSKTLPIEIVPKEINRIEYLDPELATEMYKKWLEDPNSVDTEWDSFFKNFAEKPFNRRAASGGDGASSSSIYDHAVVQNIVRGYQTRGHHRAKLDPLGINTANLEQELIKTLKIANDHPSRSYAQELKRQVAEFTKSKEVLDRVFRLPPRTFIGGDKTELPFGEILNRLENIYCRSLGAEYMHINSVKECTWIRSKIEKPGVMNLTNEEKKILLARLIRTHGFEAFLQKKYPSERRFGIEGLEVMIPCLKTIIDQSTLLGVDTVIIAMAHRGRLNVLANICRKPLKDIFAQFAALAAEDQGTGDVKYHLGISIKRLNHKTNKNVKVVLVANPSHLEAVNCVALGKTKAEQFHLGDAEGKRVLNIQIHGDASFCGQGVVYETMHLCNLTNYTVHGTIHVVANNQIGFTTDPRFSRSSPYCSDLGRVVNAPIFHVNSDEPENVIHIAKTVAEYRAKFKKDVIIDIVGYRRNGHNESDEPMFTQPTMYTLIKKTKPIKDKYTEKLIKEGIVTENDVKECNQKYDKLCEDDFALAQKEKKVKYSDWLDSPWSGFFQGKDQTKCPPTGVKEETLVHIAKIFASPPPASLSFEIHRGIQRVLKKRMEMTEQRICDYAVGEALALGSLLKEGYHVRISGEDVERGTFSWRHHILHHQKIDKVTYCPLSHLYPDQAVFSTCNSSISEFAVLGFEHGFSMHNPNALVIWEGQFGDFANGGQIIIDTYISSGQAKWVRQSGLVMNLPHGLEGLGPEHSSSRFERFLQMADDDEDVMPPPGPDAPMKQLHDINWIVAYPTVPATYFHLLRRQILLPFRKPLIIAAPKSLLRHPEAISSFKDIAEGTELQRVLPETGPAAANGAEVKRLIFCTGKVYYTLKDFRKKKQMDKDVALIRLEQLCPFPYDLVIAECEKYPKAKLIWAQEEHKNQGGWAYVKPRFNTATNHTRSISYRGRLPSAAPATGNKVQHYKECAQLENDCLLN